MKTPLLILLLLGAILAIGCNSECRQDFRLESDYAIRFTLSDKSSGENLLWVTGYYNGDSVQIYDADNNVIFPGPVGLDGRVSFYPYRIRENEIPVSIDTTEYYYLHLRKLGLDIDTFKVEYKAFFNECTFKKFEYLNFYYNEELVFSSDQERHSLNVALFK